MQHSANVIGQNVAKFRTQRGWTQEQLAAKLQLRGCDTTRDVIANIETRRCSVTDLEILYLSTVFGVKLEDLFPKEPRINGKTLELAGSTAGHTGNGRGSSLREELADWLKR